MKTLTAAALLVAAGTYAGLHNIEIPAYLLIIAGIVTAIAGIKRNNAEETTRTGNGS